MKIYWIAFIIAVIIGLGFLVMCVFNNTPIMFTSKYEVIYINTSKMQEADESIIDSTMGPSLADVFLCGKKNTRNDIIPWADAFICVTRERYGLKSDTVLLLDTALREMHDNIEPAYYWTGLRKAPKLKRCKVLIPRSIRDKIKHYKYKFCSVTLVTDD